jgi:hypothetical protein
LTAVKSTHETRALKLLERRSFRGSIVLLGSSSSMLSLALSACSGSPGGSTGNQDESGGDASEDASSGGDGDGEADVDPEPSDEAAYIYDQDEFRTYELLIDEADLATLNADPSAEQYVPGYLVFEDVQYGPVGIRYKGSLGSWVFCTEAYTEEDPFAVGGAKTCPKLNMKVSFNWSDPDGRFFGLKKLLFHAMNHDPAMMRERMGYRLFREMGVPAPRAVHNRLLINGQYAGVFLNVEYIDGRFTRSRFSDGKGNLYKEVWPTFSSLQLPTTEASLFAGLRTNEDEMPSVQKMLDFGAAVMTTYGQQRADTVDAWMDTDNTMRMVAVDRTIRADDGMFHYYCSGLCNNHNFYVYEEANDEKVWMIPWDLDNAFNVYDGVTPFDVDGFTRIIDDWNDQSIACVPHPGAIEYTPQQMPPQCDPLMNGWANFSDGYVEHVGSLINGPFSQASVDQRIADWDAQIRAAVEEAVATDPDQLSVAAWEAGIVDFRSRTEVLRADASGVGG